MTTKQDIQITNKYFNNSAFAISFDDDYNIDYSYMIYSNGKFYCISGHAGSDDRISISLEEFIHQHGVSISRFLSDATGSEHILNRNNYEIISKVIYDDINQKIQDEINSEYEEKDSVMSFI